MDTASQPVLATANHHSKHGAVGRGTMDTASQPVLATTNHHSSIGAVGRGTMDTASQPVPATANHHSKNGAVGRGRGRGRARKCPDVQNVSKPKIDPDVSVIRSMSELSVASRNIEIKPGQFDDHEVNRSFENSPHRAKHSPITSTPLKDKGTTSDKENSCSPKVQRSRRAVFDYGVLSQINKHLRKGINERTDPNITRSLDRLNGDMSLSTGSRNARLSRLLSGDLKIQIPANSVVSSSAQYGVAPIEKSTAEGRPRSHTDPMSPPSAEDRKKSLEGGAQTTSSNLLGTSQKVHSGQSAVSSPSSASKLKGRGRARGRARRRQLEMEVAARPGAALENGPSHDSSKSPIRNTATNTEQFSDATDNVSSARNDHGDQEAPQRNDLPVSVKCEPAPSSCGDGKSAQADSSPRSTTQSSSDHVSISETESADEGKSGRGLTLKIGEEEPSPESNPALCSPDDVTLLWSPNHEYILDWAAAMATPPADAEVESPDWTMSKEC